MKHALLATIVLLAAPSAFARAPQGHAPEPTALVVQEDGAKKGDTKKGDTKKNEAKKGDTKKDRAALKHYDLSKKGLALGGYDPVAYFPKFGGKAKKGSKKITATHRGVTYRFATEKNKKAFVADPESFEPMYGGWCAWAMADGKGSKTSPDPKSFTIEGGRLFVFYDGLFADTRKSWNKNGAAPKLKGRADKNWSRVSGESVRK